MPCGIMIDLQFIEIKVIPIWKSLHNRDYWGQNKYIHYGLEFDIDCGEKGCPFAVSRICSKESCCNEKFIRYIQGHSSNCSNVDCDSSSLLYHGFCVSSYMCMSMILVSAFNIPVATSLSHSSKV